MNIVKKGYLAEYDANMTALELEASAESMDFKRRLRISAGNMQQAILLAEMFLPRHGGVAFAFLSGKGLRLVTPYLMIACLLSSALLLHSPLFAVLCAGQLAVYCLAYLSYQFPFIFKHKVCKLVLYVVAGHLANFVGGVRYLLGIETGKWSKVNH